MIATIAWWCWVHVCAPIGALCLVCTAILVIHLVHVERRDRKESRTWRPTSCL